MADDPNLRTSCSWFRLILPLVDEGVWLHARAVAAGGEGCGRSLAYHAGGLLWLLDFQGSGR